MLEEAHLRRAPLRGLDVNLAPASSALSLHSAALNGPLCIDYMCLKGEKKES